MPKENDVPRLGDEELRRKLLAKRTLCLIAMLLLAPFVVTSFIACVMALDSASAAYWVLTAAAAVGAVYCLLYSIGAQGGIKRLLGENIVQDALGEALEDLRYRYGSRVAGSDIEASGLFPGWTEITGSDLAEGKYRGHAVALSDIKLVKVIFRARINGSVRRKRETLFRGQWLVFELGRALPAAVRVAEKAGRMGLTSTRKRLTAKSDVETENAAFNERFRVETEDPHTAFYVLTPHFIEYILAADAAATARTCLCFTGSRVHIALDNNRDLFEIGSRAELRDIAGLRGRIRGEIGYLTGILDELLKNTYLFGKEN